MQCWYSFPILLALKLCPHIYLVHPRNFDETRRSFLGTFFLLSQSVIVVLLHLLPQHSKCRKWLLCVGLLRNLNLDINQWWLPWLLRGKQPPFTTEVLGQQLPFCSFWAFDGRQEFLFHTSSNAISMQSLQISRDDGWTVNENTNLFPQA